MNCHTDFVAFRQRFQKIVIVCSSDRLTARGIERSMPTASSCLVGVPNRREVLPGSHHLPGNFLFEWRSSVWCVEKIVAQSS
jgi:hypothetical protein